MNDHYLTFTTGTLLMAKETLTKENSNFVEWHTELKRVARSQHGSAADADAWREDYESGKTPRQAWEDEWGWDDADSNP
ncbi:hypothetical protein GUERRERO_150 [Salmonella phage Guerrero]|nr:hypothetical protein GUERRERO_150 [Salmonella phage Guerrero]